MRRLGGRNIFEKLGTMFHNFLLTLCNRHICVPRIPLNIRGDYHCGGVWLKIEKIAKYINCWL